MRLIDADELNSIMQNVEQYFRQVGFSDDSTPLNLCKMIVEAVLNKSPTVDAEPVTHARWVHEQRYGDSGGWVWRCTACRRESITPIISAMKYCNSCGAKMDAKGDEESE